jgi:alpha-tubulin suppressor-like RCC1 family protein
MERNENEYLSDKQIIDICCGCWHSLVLTNSEVYTWGMTNGDKLGMEEVVNMNIN